MLLAALACGCGARDLPPPAASLDAELALIQERLDALEQSVLRASPRQATGDVAPDAERPAARVAEPERELIDAARIDEIAARVGRIEQQLAALAAPAARADAPLDPTPAELAVRRAARVAESQTTILDPRADEAAKLRAWAYLRAVEDSWTDSVVAEMIRIGAGSADPLRRADVWRQADARTKHQALAPALLQALASDPEPKVREEAAETLANYLERPEVRPALEHAAAHDADDDVRDQARRTLQARSR